MLSFNDFNKKKEKKNYKIVKSRSNLPMFVIDNPLSQDDDEDEDSEVKVLTDIEIEIEEPLKKEKSLPQIVSDVITRMF